MIIRTSVGAFDVERTANSLHTLSLHYASPLSSKGLVLPVSQDGGGVIFSPSLPTFLPLSLRLLLPLIIHEMQSQERERERGISC